MLHLTFGEKQNLVKDQKVSKYYYHDCSKNSLKWVAMPQRKCVDQIFGI